MFFKRSVVEDVREPFEELRLAVKLPLDFKKKKTLRFYQFYNRIGSVRTLERCLRQD